MEHRDGSTAQPALVRPDDRHLPLWRLGLGWVLLGLALLLFALWLDFRNARLGFQDQATALHADLLQKLQINEVVLAGLSAHYAMTGGTARPEVTGYVHDMLARYPHIHAMAVQPYPPQPGTVGVVDSALPTLRLAMERAVASGQTVASSPFQLTEGEAAYALVQPVRSRQPAEQSAGRAGHPSVLAFLVVQGRSLIDNSLFPDADITLLQRASSHEGQIYRFIARQADRLARAVFPRVSYMNSLDGGNQAFTLRTEKQLGWDTISLPLILALGAFVPGTAVVLAFYIRAKRASEAARTDAERALRESEARYRSLVENAAEAIVVFDADSGRFTEVNQNAERLFGMSRDQLLTLDPLSLSPERQPGGQYSTQAAGQKIEQALAGKTVEFEWLHEDARGEALYCEVRLARLPHADKRLLRGSLTDITERRRAQQQLVDTKNFLEALYDGSPDMIFLFSRRGYLVDVNQSALSECGYTRGDLLGKDFEMLMGTHYTREGVTARAREALAGRRQVFHWVARRRDGKEFPVEVRLSRVSGNRKAGQEKAYVLAVVHDITARKRAQDALFQEKERAQTTLQSIGDGVITTDVTGIIDYVNPVAEQLTGWRSDEARGRPLGEIFRVLEEQTRESLPDPVTRCLLENRIVCHTEHTLLVRDDEQEFAVKLTVAPIRDRQGKVSGAVLVLHDVTEMREIARQLTYQATHDPLTGLVNRREFEVRLEGALEMARTNGHTHALCYVDLDQFKVVNDTCGHSAGDELLSKLGSLLRAKVRDSDTLARLGGDEFGLLLECCPLEKAQEIAESLRRLIEEFRFSWQDNHFTVGGSMGLVPVTGESGNLTDVLSAADAACYMAKNLGRNRVYVSRPGDAALAQHHGEMQWVQQLRQALEQGRLELYGQRIQSVLDPLGGYEHYEVLLRLTADKGDRVLPSAFLPAAERYHLMPVIDRWVIEHAFAAVRRVAHPCRHVTLSINLSGQSLGDDRFLEFVLEQLRKPGMIPEFICFEITETAAIAHMGSAMSFIARLREMGCRFALDDFGSGLSSFAYLKSLPVDYLKIDGRFVRDVIQDPANRAMVGSISHIGHVMGIHTIAEFVENQAILDQLTVLGVDYAQGYGVGRPVPLAQCLQSLDRNAEYQPTTYANTPADSLGLPQPAVSSQFS